MAITKNKISITQKYLRLKQEYDHLEMLMAFVCKHLESGEEMQESEPEVLSLYIWWENYKRKVKDERN